MSFLIKIKRFISNCINKIYNLTITRKIKLLRSKDVVNVLFILNDLSKWKSEELYILMKKHKKFNPILGVTYRKGESLSIRSQKVLDLIKYLNQKKYSFIELDGPVRPCPEIVIYTEPYGGSIAHNQSVYKYLGSLFININYSCHTTHLPIDYYSLMMEYAWIDCYESHLAIEDAYNYIGHKRKNIKHTGLPMIDSLLTPANSDPWKKQNKNKKRIIWAPHHSIGGFANETIIYSTFLDICDYMLELACEYKDQIQIAFKPHPLLREKLDTIWGYAKAQAYYDRWRNLENCQVEEGAYSDLFKTSDAMIHDSSSFIVEYQIMNKPVLFTVRDEDDIVKDFNKFGKKAFYSQQLAYRKEEIKDFIEDLINNNDKYKSSRQSLIKEVQAPYNKSASDNILDLILGAHEKK